MLTARLVIGADGANSWLRNKADIPLTFWDYHHHALVATIRTAEPHQAVARQRSMATGSSPSCRSAIRTCARSSGRCRRGSAADAAG